jgi:hypothetical protein
VYAVVDRGLRRRFGRGELLRRREAGRQRCRQDWQEEPVRERRRGKKKMGGAHKG